MPIRTSCPSCSQPLDIVEKLQGKKVCCPECKHVFVFTGPPPAPLDNPLTEGPALRPVAGPARSWERREEGRPTERPERSAGGVLLLLLAAAILGVLLLGGGGAIIGYLMLRAQRDEFIAADQVALAEERWMAAENQMAALARPQPARIVNANLPPLPPPLPIQPPPLDQERVEVAVDSPIGDVLPAGGGRFLLLHLPDTQKVAVFDVNAGKIVHHFMLADRNVHLAAGMEHLIVASERRIDRYSLKTRRLEQSAQLPFTGKVKAMGMGSASAGPLLVGLEDRPAPGPGGAFMPGEWHLLDVRSLAPIRLDRELGPFPFGTAVVHASADGRVFSIWLEDPREGGISLPKVRQLVLMDSEVREYSACGMEGGPGWFVIEHAVYYGRVYYGRDQLANQMHLLKTNRPDGPFHVPAARGACYFRLASKPQGDGLDLLNPPPSGPVSLYRVGIDKPLVTLENLVPDLGGERWQERNKFPVERRLHLIPEAKLIASVPGSNNKLILQKFDVAEALRKLEAPYLCIASEPPLAARPGERFAYQLRVLSSAASVRYRLESGPPEMRLDDKGLLSWQVPPNLTDAETPVVLSARDAAGREVLQPFYINHPGNLPPDPRVAAGEAPPPPPAPPPLAPPLQAPRMEGDRLEYPLPFSVDRVVTGGNGRYLILHADKLRKLAIFDVNQARIVKELPLPEGEVHVAAGMDKLIVILPGGLLQRWNLMTLERETTVILPVHGPLKSVAMGSASNGPLLLLQRDGPLDNSESDPLTLIDLTTLKPLPVRWPMNGPNGDQATAYAIRASADGRVFGLQQHRPQQRNLIALVCNGANVQLHQRRANPEEADTMYLMPGPDGKVLYTAMGRFNERLEPIGPPVKDGPMFVPAEHGDYYLSVEVTGHERTPREGGAIWVHRIGADKPLLKVPDFDAGILAGRGQWLWPRLDQRLHLLPDIGLFIALTGSNDRLILQRLDLQAAGPR